MLNSLGAVPRVFISYSHDSEDHRKKVADLCQTLRVSGIDAWIDQFVESDPPLSWPRWMTNQVQEADYVLLVSTEIYMRRFLGRETPGRGLGVRWEGAIITSEMYEAEADDRAKFIPVLLKADDAMHIPSPLRLTTFHVLGSPGGWTLTPLLRQLLGQPALSPAPIGTAPNLSDAPQIESEIDTIRAARELAEDEDWDSGIELLEDLANDPKSAPDAVMELGRLHQKRSHYVAAITAFQRVLEISTSERMRDEAARGLEVTLQEMNQHFGEGSAVAAATYFLENVQSRGMKHLWPLIEPSLRLTLVQAWLYANRDHPRLEGYSLQSIAPELAEIRSAHPLWKDFAATQLNEIREGYGGFSSKKWGAAERPRRFGIDYELVLLFRTNEGQAAAENLRGDAPRFGLILKRVGLQWLIASFDESTLPVPGWPPNARPIPVDLSSL